MIVAGFGFRAAASEASLADAYARAAQGFAVDRLAAPADKAEAAALQRLAAALCLPVLPIDAPALQAVQTLTGSPASLRHRHTGSVAEATALAGAGPGARLIGQRSISADRMAVAALARSGDPA